MTICNLGARYFIQTFAIIATIAALSGCATYAPSAAMVGLSRQQVIERLGPPEPAPENLAIASRLDFPRGPYGKHTYSAEFDDEGRAVRFRQLLREENFAKIKPGMEQREVIELIGIAKDTFGLARNRGYVWNYRYITPFCQWFQIEFTMEHVVRSAGYGKPPECSRRLFLLR